jgi:predicted transcriptional regulator
MARTPHDVTDTELALLQQLWEHGPATVRQLTDALYPGGRASHVATVYKLLERLEAKDCVRRERRDGTYLFRAAIGRDDVIGRRLEDLVEKLCGGSLQPLLSHLVRVKRLTAEELQELLALVDELDAQAKRKSKRG